MSKAIAISRADLLQYWSADYTTAQIQALLGVGHGTFWRAVKRHQMPKKPSRDMSGANSPSWKGGWSEYYGPNWERQRTTCLKRDNYTCRRCGITKEEMDREPDVHHLKPIRTFKGDYERANALPNLVSLCCACHTYCERHPREPLPAEPDPSLRADRPHPRKSTHVQPTMVDPEIVKARYLSGESEQVTLKDLGISHMTYYRSLRRAGITPDRVRRVDKMRLHMLLHEGMSRKDAAAAVGCALPTVYKLFPLESR